MRARAKDSEVIKDLRNQVKKALKEMNEMKLLLDIYKACPQEKRDKAQIMAAEKKARQELDDVKSQLKKVSPFSLVKPHHQLCGGSTSSVFIIFGRLFQMPRLAKMDGARSKVKVDLNSLVNGLFGPQSHKMGWEDVLRSKIRFPWN